MFLYLELESRTPLLTNVNSLEEQTAATPPEVTAFLNTLQERPYTIETVFEQSSSPDSTDVETSNPVSNLSTDSTDGEISNPVSNLKDYLRKYSNWSDWRFNVYIKTMVTFKPENEEKEGKEAYSKIMVEINILQAAILRQDIRMVKLISSLAKEGDQLEKLLDYEVKLEFNSKWVLSPCSKWIVNASAIHLASYFHFESLKHLLIIHSELIDIDTPTGVNRVDYINASALTSTTLIKKLNQQYQPNRFSPLHIASTSDKNTVAVQFLIKKKAKVENTDFEGKTALHVASRNGCIKNVIALIFDGKANVIEKDYSGETPMHQAKTSKILDIFLMKTDANQILGSDDKAEIKLFDRILQNHPSSMKSYLDKMVTSINPDSNIQDQHLIFHFSMFNQDTTRKQNYFDKHLKLINSDCSNMLRHPLMALFMSLKWQRHHSQYSVNFFIFLMFLFIFTTHGKYCIDYLQCDECDDPVKQEECEDEEQRKKCEKFVKEICMKNLSMVYNITGYLSLGLLTVLVIMEILQFVSKVLIGEVKEYFTKQNLIEVAMLVTTSAFFVVQFIDDGYWLLEHLLGWALFLAWMDLTLFLARFDLFGKHIYLSWHVLKKVGWSLVVYVPSVIAFSMAFHAFLRRNEIFQGTTTSVIKVLTMLLGEFDFADNFLFDKVKKDGDSNFSAQVTFIYVESCLF